MSKQESQYIYAFETELFGFINLDEPGGKYNTCGFRFTMPNEVINLAEQDREELLEKARSKVEYPQRLGVNPPKWDDDGRVKYSYSGDTNRIAPVIIDQYGDPFSPDLLRVVREGTKVQLLVEQKPYWKPTIGTTIIVHGIQILELVTGGSCLQPTYPIERVKELLGVKQ